MTVEQVVDGGPAAPGVIGKKVDVPFAHPSGEAGLDRAVQVGVGFHRDHVERVWGPTTTSDGDQHDAFERGKAGIGRLLVDRKDRGRVTRARGTPPRVVTGAEDRRVEAGERRVAPPGTDTSV